MDRAAGVHASVHPKAHARLDLSGLALSSDGYFEAAEIPAANGIQHAVPSHAKSKERDS